MRFFDPATDEADREQLRTLYFGQLYFGQLYFGQLYFGRRVSVGGRILRMPLGSAQAPTATY